MCIANDQLGRGGRGLRVAANLVLVAGLLLWNFARPAGKPIGPWFDATVGLLMGVSIGVNLLLVARGRRRNHTA